MNKKTGLNLELATHPLRNRRFYFSVLALLAVLLAGLAAVTIDLYFDYKKKLIDNRAMIENLENRLRNIQREEIQMANRMEDEDKHNRQRIDLINDLIYRKSFSWVDFLSALEEALPARCYIVSLSPAPKEDLDMEVRIKVASPGLNDLLLLFTRLGNLGFKDVLIRSEELTASGLLLAEVTFNYERNI
jgi:Tfp pilus assembly protein PilN